MVAYSFKAQFAEPIEQRLKRQTIRADRKRHARPGEPFPPRPNKGDAFVIVGIDRGRTCACVLIFAEFPGITFDARDWKPVVKTDISELEEIARKITQGETVDA